MTASAHHAIGNLIARYAELLDDGDFAGLGLLLADATFIGSGEPVHGSAAIERLFRDTLIVYADGTPRTQHVVTNTVVEFDDDIDVDGGDGDGDDRPGTAAARSYVTVLQALPGLPLRPIAAGRYHDRFRRLDGRWRFTERRVRITLLGDVSHHLRAGNGDPRGGR
ncbi:nuclear transport factor 2 family protein [Kitasatospora sp. NPDC056446]|uniref:nuclear transport factor 2 family protein n=1 Tax=Kitasatospora sp. NPDC056446 TaxID=3345819 RepID=UPI0036CE0E24